MHITFTGHLFRFTLLVLGRTPLCLQNCLNASWHRFNKMLEIFLRYFGPYWHESITQLLQICRLHIHDAILPFHHIPKVLYTLISISRCWNRKRGSGGKKPRSNGKAQTRICCYRDLDVGQGGMSASSSYILQWLASKEAWNPSAVFLKVHSKWIEV